MNVATLTAKMVMDVSGFGSGANKAIGYVNQLKGGIGSLTVGMAAGAAGGLAMAGGMAVLNAGMSALTTTANAAKDALMWGAQLAADQEQAQVAFSTMLHSGEKATAMLKDLEKFATATPFDFPQVRDAAKSLLGMGIAAEKVQPSLKTLGEISSGVGVPLGQLAMVFGQVKTAGRLMTQDMNQFTSAGVALPRALAKELGIAETRVREFVEKGKVSFSVFQNALVRLAETDFAGGMEKQSKTALGALSTLQDSAGGLFKDLAADIGEKFKVTEWINDLAGFLGYVRENWGPALVGTFDAITKGLIDALEPLRTRFIQLLGVMSGIERARASFHSPLSLNDKLGGEGGNENAVFLDMVANGLKKGANLRDNAAQLQQFFKDHSITNPAGEGLKRESGGGSFTMTSLANFIEAGKRLKGWQAGALPASVAQGMFEQASQEKRMPAFFGEMVRGKGLLGALGNVVEDIGFAGGRVASRFGKRSDIPEQQKTGALQVGSSEAFSKIIDAMTGRDRNSTAKASLETLKAIEKAAMSQVDKLSELIKAAGGTVVNAFSG